MDIFVQPEKEIVNDEVLNEDDASFLEENTYDDDEIDNILDEDVELEEIMLEGVGIQQSSDVLEFEKELKLDLDDEEIVRNLSEEKQKILEEIRNSEEYKSLKALSPEDIKSMREFNFHMYVNVRNDTKQNPKAPFYAHNDEVKQREFLKCKYDIIYFAENYVTLSTVSGRIKFMLSDEIRTALRLAEASVFETFQTSRQSSKSTSTHVVAAWYFNFWKNSKMGLVNTTVDAGKKNLRYIMDVMDGIPKWMKTFDPNDKRSSDNIFSKISQTGSEMRTAVVDKQSPESSLRGNTYALIIEELAFLKNIQIAYSPISFTYNTYSSIAASTYTPAPFMIVTTPNDVNSPEGAFFFEIWENSYLVTYDLIKDMLPFEINEFFLSQGISKVKVFAEWYTFPNRATNPKLLSRPDFKSKIKPVLDNPESTIQEIMNIDKGLAAWLVKTKNLCRTLKDVKKEIYCLFLSTNDNAIFEEFVVDEMNRAAIDPISIYNLNGFAKYLPELYVKQHATTSKRMSIDLKIYKKLHLEKSEKIRYFLTVDPAFSLHGDFCSFLVVDLVTLDIVATCRTRIGKVHNIYPIIKEIISDVFNGRCVFSVENNSIGVAVKEDCEADAYLRPKMYYTIYEGKYAGQEDNDLRIYGHSTNVHTRPLMMTELMSFVTERFRDIKCKDLALELGLLEEKNSKIQASKGSHDDLSLALAQALYIFVHEKKTLRKLTYSANALNRDLEKIQVMNRLRAGQGISPEEMLSQTQASRESNAAILHEQAFEEFKTGGRKTISGLFKKLNG